jgi:hypothetical protein
MIASLVGHRPPSPAGIIAQLRTRGNAALAWAARIRLEARMAKTKSHPAGCFLKIVAALIVLAIAAAFAYRLFETQLMRWAMVPNVPFAETPLPAGADYRQSRMWVARPDIAGNPASWTPQGVSAAPPRASVFFVHPTSYMDARSWNAPIDDPESRDMAARFVRGQASAFNGVAAIWAPRYRQATFGAFLTDAPEAAQAFDLAYRDVLAAYEEFVREAPAERPIILAAHSQGSRHLMRLLAERIRGRPEAQRIAAIYLIGWPVPARADLAFPACSRPDEAACILSWQSFAEPADPSQLLDPYGQVEPMLCTNPLTGAPGGNAPATANLGTLLLPEEEGGAVPMRPGLVGARCDPRGLLLIGEVETLPELGNYALPGNNYHVYDYGLFWANIRADAARRLAAYEGPR